MCNWSAISKQLDNLIATDTVGYYLTWLESDFSTLALQCRYERGWVRVVAKLVVWVYSFHTDTNRMCQMDQVTVAAITVGAQCKLSSVSRSRRENCDRLNHCRCWMNVLYTVNQFLHLQLFWYFVKIVINVTLYITYIPKNGSTCYRVHKCCHRYSQACVVHRWYGIHDAIEASNRDQCGRRVPPLRVQV